MRTLIKDIHFEMLGISRTATKEEIKKAYREKIKIWHPDKFPNQPDKLQEALERSKNINEAYDLLKNYEPPVHSTGFQSYTTKAKQDNPFDHKTKSAKYNVDRLEIERIMVKSSNINSIGYDAKIRVLQVQFNSGSVYQYYDVPVYVYDEFLKADSKGKYLNRNIVYKFRFARV